jgi:hypothetical protein
MLKNNVTLVSKQGDTMGLKKLMIHNHIQHRLQIITHCHANRITVILPTSVSSEQCYCTPGRSTHRTLHLIQGEISCTNTSNNLVTITSTSLDQSCQAQVSTLSASQVWSWTSLHTVSKKRCLTLKVEF